jgi:hypothetical protein
VTSIESDPESDDPADADDDSQEDWEDGMLGAVRFDGLSPTEFEDFCFDLMSETGFVNVDWRKGTPRDASPADRGRDIVAQLQHVDVDGHQYLDTWFVDCKHYERGVPPDAFQNTIAWAQAERPTTVLFIASGYFTNGAKDWIAQYEANTHPPFRIRTWEMPQIRRLLTDHLDVAFRQKRFAEYLTFSLPKRSCSIDCGTAEVRIVTPQIPRTGKQTSWRGCELTNARLRRRMASNFSMEMSRPNGRGASSRGRSPLSDGF